MAHAGGQSCLKWDWTPDTWDWDPSVERWSPKKGQPKGSARLTVSTTGLDASDSYDFWREAVFYNFQAARKPVIRRDHFSAHAVALLADCGEFYTYRSDPITGDRKREHIARDDCDNIDIGLVIAGTRYQEGTDRRCWASAPGEFFIFDYRQPSHVEWTAHRGAHFRLNRTWLQEVFGYDLPLEDALSKALSGSPLAPFLKTQYGLLARKINHLSNDEREIILSHTRSLTLETLRHVGCDHFGPGKMTSLGLRIVAKRYIDQHLCHPGLDAVMIADHLGCSRATLYRAFKDQSFSVAGYIREQRLQLFMGKLRKAGEKKTLAFLAQECGFNDYATFNKTFQRRFDMTPGDARENAALDQAPPLTD